MLLICADGTEGPIDAEPELDIDEWVEQMDGRGIRSIGERLAPPADATTVRAQRQGAADRRPFVETKEIIWASISSSA
jgi:hypothetical protein